MNMGDFNLSWLAAGGMLALIAGFWDKLKAFVRQMSKVMIVQMDLDSIASMDMARYIRAHYKWVEFSTFNVRTIYRTRLDNGLGIWVPFKTPENNGLYHGPHGWVWIDSTGHSLHIRAIRGTVDFLQMVKDSNEFDNRMRMQTNQNRFYISKVIGSEKGAWALGEAISRRNETGYESPSPAGSASKAASELDPPMMTKVYEDLDTSFMYDKDLFVNYGEQDPFKGLFYKEDALHEVENARKWMGMRRWYAQRSIPHRRGLMLYGPGGTGKSSFVKGLAESLGIPLYQYYLNTLSDQEFIREWGRMQTPCVALLEDFDNVFHGREPQTEHKALTFDAVLNTISGVSSFNGVFLVVTTNHLEHVDPAMGISKSGAGGISTRPGRIDSVLYMGESSDEQRMQIVKHILRDWPEVMDATMAKTEGMTPAQVQETCIQVAYERLAQ